MYTREEVRQKIAECEKEGRSVMEDFSRLFGTLLAKYGMMGWDRNLVREEWENWWGYREEDDQEAN